MTRVISVRGRDRGELLADPDFVYVGRAVFRTKWREASPWSNPFKSAEHGADAVAKYRERLEEQIRRDPGVLARLRSELLGKTLGCWCGDWRPGEPEIACHAVVLAKLADEADRVAPGPEPEDK